MWRLYTPEFSVDKNDIKARSLCHAVCSQQPSIKDKVTDIDIAHMSATALGYIHWGIPKNKGYYSLGDLGGWSLIYYKCLEIIGGLPKIKIYRSG